MDIFPQTISPVLLLRPKRHGDERGYFSELYSIRALEAHGLSFAFVQDNISLSAEAGTVRGLHFQTHPCEQTKLVSVLTGAIVDVAVDLRVDSPTFGRHVATELSAENGLQMLVPRGFAHGFCTLLPDTRVLYKVDGFYDAKRDLGLRWNDPALGIKWPTSDADAKLSAKDRVQPLLSELPSYFSNTGAAA
jgi:dTDP-4-dehydrorhamnose 3,5-epimerase